MCLSDLLQGFRHFDLDIGHLLSSGLTITALKLFLAAKFPASNGIVWNDRHAEVSTHGQNLTFQVSCYIKIVSPSQINIMLLDVQSTFHWPWYTLKGVLP